MKFEFAPLKSSFVIISIVGFIISALWVYKRSPSWGFAFCLVFVMMFIASMVSMTYGPVGEELQIDEKRKKKKKKKIINK